MNFSFKNISADNISADSFFIHNGNFPMDFNIPNIFSGILVNYCAGVLFLFVIRGIMEHRYFKLCEFDISIGKYKEKLEIDNAFFIGIFDTLILFCLAVELVILKLYF